MLRRIFKTLIAAMFPWLILMMDDNPGGAFVSLIMQVTIVGWPFAAMWAIRVQRENEKYSRKQKKKKRQKEQEDDDD